MSRPLDLSVWDAAENVRRATSFSDIAEVAKQYAVTAGFAHHGFAVKFPSREEKAAHNYHNFHNIPEPWGSYRYQDTYSTEKADRDPLVQHLRLGLPPTAFSRSGIVTHTRSEIIRRGLPILQRAGDYGVNAGILAPLSGPRMLWGFMIMTTADTSDVREVLSILPNLYFFANFVLSATRDLLDAPRPVPRLSPRERQMLQWAAVGKTSWEIGIITKVSEKTVDFHLASACHKLRVNKRTAAVARAAAWGLIAP